MVGCGTLAMALRFVWLSNSRVAHGSSKLRQYGIKCGNRAGETVMLLQVLSSKSSASISAMQILLLLLYRHSSLPQVLRFDKFSLRTAPECRLVHQDNFADNEHARIPHAAILLCASRPLCLMAARLVCFSLPLVEGLLTAVMGKGRWNFCHHHCLRK